MLNREKKPFYSVPGTVQSVNDEYSKEWKKYAENKINIKNEDNRGIEKKSATFYCSFHNKFLQSICSSFSRYLVPYAIGLPNENGQYVNWWKWFFSAAYLKWKQKQSIS